MLQTVAMQQTAFCPMASAINQRKHCNVDAAPISVNSPTDFHGSRRSAVGGKRWFGFDGRATAMSAL